MTQRIVLMLATIASAMVGGSIVGSVPHASAQNPLHLDTGRLLLDQILDCQDDGIYADANGVALNRYGGSWGSKTDPSFIRFASPAQGVLPGNNTKCSPLVTHLLKYSYNWNWKNYTFYDPLAKANKSVSSPTPYQYIALIQQGKGLTEVRTLDDAQPGDILNWWQVGSDVSDHTMLIDSIDWNSAKPYLLGYPNSDPTLAGTTFYEVHVIDSSADTHTADSRWVNVNGAVTQISGIGRGIIGILVDENYEIVGSTWSLPTSNYVTQPNTWTGSINTRLKRTPKWEFAIGRLP